MLPPDRSYDEARFRCPDIDRHGSGNLVIVVLFLRFKSNGILSGTPECVREEILVGDFLFDLHPNRNPHPSHNRFPFPLPVD
jgi:hypothetical protein